MLCRIALPLFFVLLCPPLVVAAPQAPLAPEGNTGRYELSTASAGNAMVVTANPLASLAARDMLWAGGSAIDAAIAAQAVLGLVEPQSSGFGGGAFIVYHDGKKTLSIDGRETAPASAQPNRFLGSNGKPLPFYTAVNSGLGVGVPGALAALEESHRRYGKLPWKSLFAPAIRHAREGFPVSPRLHMLIARDRLLAKKTHARDYFLAPDGSAWPAGHLLKNPAYAAALEKIANSGSKEFYRGKLMQGMVKSLTIEGADLSEEDWKNYQPKVAPALCQPYRQYSVCSAPPPSGGLAVLQTLAILDGLGRENDEALRLHQLTEAERLSFADRQRYSADPALVPVPVAALLQKDYVASRRALIGERSMGTASAGTPPGLSSPWGQDGQLLENGTTQIVIADANGHWLSMTSSIEDAFGSRLLIDGMLLNNQLTDFSFLPAESGRPLANRVQPGKRPRSAMSPVIVLDENGRPILALGSPGGSRIIGYVLRALVASLDEGMSPGEVVQLPHVLSRNGATEIDSDLAIGLRESLEARGHTLEPGDMNSGLAIIRRQRGRLEGAADPRREGMATGF
ncbi:MAG: gamma-glutamyltransferase [Moraxellaceae bacterium]|nr:gamma-glutamyltransferase [Moraxellaceae bacterium]